MGKHDIMEGILLELMQEVDKKIKHRAKYETMDFSLAHTFLWLSILSSFTSSILIASKYAQLWPMQVAVLAGIPALVILIDKTFDFAKRATWGAMYKIELQELRDELKYGTVEPKKAAEKLREIEKRNEISFFQIGFFGQKKGKDNDGKTGGNQEG